MTATFDEKLSLERVRNQLEIPGYFSMQPEDLRAVLTLAEREAARSVTSPLQDAVVSAIKTLARIGMTRSANLRQAVENLDYARRASMDECIRLSQALLDEAQPQLKLVDQKIIETLAESKSK